MLVTRALVDSDDTIARLRALGIAGVPVPLLDCVPMHTSLPKPQGFAALALTSANALRMLAQREALAPYLGLKVFAVGDKTAAAAERYGFLDVTASGGTLAHLVREIAAAGLAGPVFYPTARHQSGNLAKELAPFGIMVVTTKVYEMRAAQALPAEIIDGLAAHDFAAALFYSRRTAETFVELTEGRIGRDVRTRLGMLCLSENVAGPLVAARFTRIGLADQPSEEAMMALALSFARDQNAP
jgi:uroporphyrinogen-III synthase